MAEVIMHVCMTHFELLQFIVDIALSELSMFDIVVTGSMVANHDINKPTAQSFVFIANSQLCQTQSVESSFFF